MYTDQCDGVFMSTLPFLHECKKKKLGFLTVDGQCCHVSLLFCFSCQLSGGLIEDVMKHSPEQCMKFEDIFTQMQSLKSSPELKE